MHPILELLLVAAPQTKAAPHGSEGWQELPDITTQWKASVSPEKSPVLAKPTCLIVNIVSM